MRPQEYAGGRSLECAAQAVMVVGGADVMSVCSQWRPTSNTSPEGGGVKEKKEEEAERS